MTSDAVAPEAGAGGPDLDPDSGYLTPPDLTLAGHRLYEADLDSFGYVMNLTRLWAHQPALKTALFDLINAAAEAAALTLRQRGVLIAACASTLGDSYCSLAWGARLAGEADDDVAARVLIGDDGGLDPAEQALAGWARTVAGDPNGTSAADVEPLRTAGYGDAQILALTAFVTLRLAFSTVNDALGVLPDHELRVAAPSAVLDAVTFGRPIAAGSSTPPG